MANYSRGTSANIIVGAAALFTYESGPLGLVSGTGAITDAKAEIDVPDFVANVPFTETLTANSPAFRNVGYTMNGLELSFQPDFGEVQVDQVLDAARLFKQGMQVNLNTAFAESTLENLLVALALDDSDRASVTTGIERLRLSAGDIGDVPLERGLVAVGPGSGSGATADDERVYIAYRALSIETVNVSAKRDEATMFEVSFRLLPNDNASYGKIVDRTGLATGDTNS